MTKNAKLPGMTRYKVSCGKSVLGHYYATAPEIAATLAVRNANKDMTIYINKVGVIKVQGKKHTYWFNLDKVK
jgi:hypothetical protein